MSGFCSMLSGFETRFTDLASHTKQAESNIHAVRYDESTLSAIQNLALVLRSLHGLSTLGSPLTLGALDSNPGSDPFSS